MRINSKVIVEKMGLVSVASAAKRAGVCVGTLRLRAALGLVPKAKIRMGKRKFYTADDAEEVRRYFAGTVPTPALAENLVNRSEMARRLGVSIHKFKDCICAGYVSPPTIRRGRRKYYRPDEEPTLREQLENLPPVPHVNPHEHEGFKNITQAAEVLGVPTITLEYWRYRRGLPSPSHQVGRFLYYTDAEVEELREYMKAKGYARFLTEPDGWAFL